MDGTAPTSRCRAPAELLAEAEQLAAEVLGRAVAEQLAAELEGFEALDQAEPTAVVVEAGTGNADGPRG